jgi:hypothetical protein
MSANHRLNGLDNSEDMAGIRFNVLCIWILILFVIIEVVSGKLRDHRQISVSIMGDIDSAIAVRHSANKMQVVFAGNSLVYEGLSQPVLQEIVGTRFSLSLAGVPGSTYFDWLYGLRALFARGSEPDVVVFGISPSQFLRAPAVTSLPVSRLWRGKDVLSYYQDWKPGLTTTGSLLLEHYSTFFSMRDVFRIYARKQIPGYSSMVEQSGASATPESRAGLPTKGMVDTYKLRLGALQTECKSHARLILIIVPTRQIEDETDEVALKAAARHLDIPLIEPIRERAWPITQFQTDGYHLTPKAAAEFSVSAGKDLTAILGNTSHYRATQQN